ncbi:MAG: TolC family protein [Spirochaetes bacterium]|nr:TolC family protein [Spirochaetota bacterium]
MSVKPYCIVFCIFSTFLSSEAASLGEYRRVAKANSPRLKIKEANAAAAKDAHLQESFAKANPDLTLGIMNAPLATFPAINRDSMSGIFVGVSQKLALPWEDHYRKAAAAGRAESDAREAAIAAATLDWELGEKYNALIYSIERRAILNAGKEIMRSNLAVLSRSIKRQANIVPQILETKANLTLIENDLINIDFEIERLFLELDTLCGVTVDRTLTAAERKAWLAENDELAQDFKFEISKNLQYRRLRADVDAQTAMLSLSKSSLFPEVTLNASMLMRQQLVSASGTMAGGDNLFSVSATTPLPIFYSAKNRHEIDAQRERLRAAEETLREATLTLENSWKTEILRRDALAKAIDNYTHSIVPAHASAHKTHLATATAQGMGVGEALAAYQMVVKSSEERLKLIRDLHSTLYKLEFLAAKEKS